MQKMNTKNKKNLTKNIILLILLTIVLKGFGFLNKMIIAYYFGTTEQTDIYYNASGFADSISLVILASLSVGVINIYMENKNKKGNDIFITNLTVNITCIMLFIALIIGAFSDTIAYLLAPAYSSTASSQLSFMLRLMCITFPFQGIIAVYSAVLQAERDFTPVKLTGTITSIISIICVCLLSIRFGVTSLMISYIVSTIFNAFLLMYKSRNLFKFKLHDYKIDNDMKRLFFIIAPLLLGTAANQFNLIVDKSIASSITSGAISALSYSCVLYLFIENIIINSIVTATFPEITENVIQNRQDKVSRNTQKSLFIAEILLIPVVICTIFFSKDITKIVYMRGSFNATSLTLTSEALTGYVIGLPFYALRDISTHVFYAYGDTKKPVIINIMAVFINITLDIILSKYFGIFGITIATSISSIFSGCILFIGLKKYNKKIFDKTMKKEILKVLIVNLIVLAFIIATALTFDNTFLFILVAIISYIIEILFLRLFKSLFIKEAFNLLK